jgi:hypothetical protein
MSFLRRTGRRLAVSPYTLFMKQTAKSIPTGKGGIRARGKAVAKAYKALGKAEKAKLVAAAKKAPTPEKKVPKAKKPRKAGAYAKFVKKNYPKVMSVAPKLRMAAIAKIWRGRQC